MPCSGHRPVHTEEGAPFELLIGFYPEVNRHHSASIALGPCPLTRHPHAAQVGSDARHGRERQENCHPAPLIEEGRDPSSMSGILVWPPPTR
jgi:hypothetical protein